MSGLRAEIAALERTARHLYAADPSSLRRTTINWLRAWTFSTLKGPHKLPTTAMIVDLAPYRPSKPVRLWRYARTPEHESAMNLRSFTHDRAMAFSMRDEFNDGRGDVIETIVHPRHIVVDFTLLPQPLREEFLNEVIVSRYDLDFLRTPERSLSG